MTKKLVIEFEFSAEQVLNLFNYSDTPAECVRNIKAMMSGALNHNEHDNKIAMLAEEILNCNQDELDDGSYVDRFQGGF